MNFQSSEEASPVKLLKLVESWSTCSSWKCRSACRYAKSYGPRTDVAHPKRCRWCCTRPGSWSRHWRSGPPPADLCPGPVRAVWRYRLSLSCTKYALNMIIDYRCIDYRFLALNMTIDYLCIDCRFLALNMIINYWCIDYRLLALYMTSDYLCIDCRFLALNMIIDYWCIDYRFLALNMTIDYQLSIINVSIVAFLV